jgi:hypothetical protein
MLHEQVPSPLLCPHHSPGLTAPCGHRHGGLSDCSRGKEAAVDLAVPGRSEALRPRRPRRHGVHDFDLWGFFQKLSNQPFPYRRQGQHDFGPSRFGHNPEDSDRFVGRQVGVFGRSINMRSPKMPIEAVQRWLSEAPTKSARFLAQQSAVVIWPRRDLGRVIWDGGKQVDAQSTRARTL